MLGSTVARYLATISEFNVTATCRERESVGPLAERFPGIEWRPFDATLAESSDALQVMEGVDWVVNAIGIIKPLIHDDNAQEVERAIRINSMLPHQIARMAEGSGTRVLQIATDCVYSGMKGGYVETDIHDALDVYGKTKSLGEVYSPNVFHLRCSIIGPEIGKGKSLLEWFRSQPQGAQVSGYTNHDWNGVTTLHYGKVCGGIMLRELALPHLQHVVPSGGVTKCELLQSFASSFDRADIVVKPGEAATVIDRTLGTVDPDLNMRLWEAAGYTTPPSVPEMVAELAAFEQLAVSDSTIA